MSEELNLHASQLELEKLYNKNQLMTRLRAEFSSGEDGYLVRKCQMHDIPVEFGIDLVCQMWLHKQTTADVLLGVLQHHNPDLQVVAGLLEKAVEADLVDYNSQTGRFILLYMLTAETQLELEMFQYPLPMLVPPQKVNSNRDSGYLLGFTGSLLLRNNHHDKDICLDHINRLNQIEFCLDMDTAGLVQNSWRHLDKPKPGETKFDFDARRRAFEKYDRTARDIMDEMVRLGNKFYLTHKYDKRGRTYCQGYHVNYQGAPWNKATLELAHKEYVD